ncbi:MAG: VWA domain-containing protein [Planctomycetes bacterium]|nr:VWA domain-containing protein [Planctomycetota bacterium]
MPTPDAFDPVVPPAPEDALPLKGGRIRLRCTYCHDPLERALAACAGCLAPHHARCFRAHGRCAAPGCGATRTLAPARRGRTLVAATAATLALGAVAWLGASASSLGAAPAVAAGSPATIVAPAATPCGPVVVTAEAEHAAVFDPADPEHLVVTVRAAAAAPASAERPPLRVVLLVDRSGSMGWGAGKMEHARRAVGAFLAGLGPRDAAAVVGFDDQVEVVVPWSAGGAVAPDDPRVQALSPRGGTDIARALEAADALLADAPPGGEARRVVLLTDGRDGSRRDLRAIARGLRAGGATLSCHGFGADADAPLLGDLAELGGGGFLFVDSGERAVRAFEAERDRALATVALGVEVRVEPAPGVSIEEVVSWQARTDGGARVVTLGELAAGLERKVVVRLRWSEAAGRDGAVPLARVICRAAPLGGVPATVALSVEAALAADAAAARASARPHLGSRLAEARFALAMQGAQARLERGDVDGARREARAAYAGLAAHDDALERVRGRSYVASDAGARYYASGELPEDAATLRALIPSTLLPVGK